MFSNSGTFRNERHNVSCRSRFSAKHRNMNILSALLGTATLVVLCACLVEPEWFKMTGGKCCLSKIGLNMFFGVFSLDEFSSSSVKSCEGGDNDVSFCVDAEVVMLMHVVIAFCFLAIISSLYSFVLDVISPRKRPFWKSMKRYAIGYILCVLHIATVIGFAFWASEALQNVQMYNKQFVGSKIEVTFGTGVYLATTAGGIAILATAANLMRQYPTEEEEQAEQLLEAMEEAEEEANRSSPGNGDDPEPPPAYIP